MIYPVYFADEGEPKTGLSPIIDIFIKVSDGTSAGSPPAVSELSGGFYKFTVAPAEDILVRVDSEDISMSGADRYIVRLLTPHDDDLDIAVSSVEDNIRGADSDTLKTLSDQVDGTSTHTPANVWAVGTRTLTGFGTLVADVATAVWGAGTRTLTGFGTLLADIWSYATRTLTADGDATEAKQDIIIADLGTHDGKLDGVIAKTDNLPADTGEALETLAIGNSVFQFIAASEINETRKVAKGILDRFVIKAYDDAGNVISTKTLYYWYETLGDTNPTDVKKESS